MFAHKLAAKIPAGEQPIASTSEPFLLPAPGNNIRQCHALSYEISHLLALLRTTPPRQTRLPPRLPITLSKPLARLDHLHNIYPLLNSHKGGRGKHADPRNRGIHLVGTSHLHGCRRERASKEHGGFGSGGRARLDGGWVVEVGEEGGREERRAEGEEVEGDEEHFVHEAQGEKNLLLELLAYALRRKTSADKRTLLE